MKLFHKILGSGPPIVILHGFLGTLDNWITVARHLSTQYTVYLIDQRNHGQSPHSDNHSLDAMANDLTEFLEDHHIEAPILIGHSMGGKVVMRFAQMYPEGFRTMIVVDIAPRYYPPHHQQIFNGLNNIDLSKLEGRGKADEMLAPFIAEPGIRQFLLKNLTRVGNTFQWKANLAVLENSMEQVGESIASGFVSDQPVFVIRGDRSDYVQNEDRVTIKKMFPLAKIVTIKNAGHWVHAENQPAFISTLESVI